MIKGFICGNWVEVMSNTSNHKFEIRMILSVRKRNDKNSYLCLRPQNIDGDIILSESYEGVISQDEIRPWYG
tara:strand:+ start:1789 stop:2004 length:216 start_codon:yes stop_codon:yes gene_type:complete